MLVGGQIQDWSERDDVGIVDRNEVIRVISFA